MRLTVAQVIFQDLLPCQFLIWSALAAIQRVFITSHPKAIIAGQSLVSSTSTPSSSYISMHRLTNHSFMCTWDTAEHLPCQASGPEYRFRKHHFHPAYLGHNQITHSLRDHRQGQRESYVSGHVTGISQFSSSQRQEFIQETKTV